MTDILTDAAAFYAGGACVVFIMVKGGFKNKIVSALLWPTLPLWPRI